VTDLPLKYVQRFRDRHGKWRHYFRRPGFKRFMLPGLPGSAEFMDAYQAALAGESMEIGVSRVKAGTFDALIVAYFKSAEFQILSASTQRAYRVNMQAFRRSHGGKPVVGLETRHIRAMLDAKAATPSGANNLRRILRLLMAFAVERNWRRENPMAGVKKLSLKSSGFHSWTEDEIAQFEATHQIGTRERLAFGLLLFTAQRRSDVVTMGRQHVRGGSIQVKQQKTGTRLSIPVHPELQKILDAETTANMTFLVTAYGKPFAPAGFNNWFHRAVVAAGLPDHCTPHGLRKAASRRLAEAGCTPHQIMAVTGHKNLSEVTLYTAASDQVRLAEEALERLDFANVGRTKTVKPSE
jgi:integrase